jgi:hypothetical protein
MRLEDYCLLSIADLAFMVANRLHMHACVLLAPQLIHKGSLEWCFGCLAAEQGGAKAVIPTSIFTSTS